MGGIQKNLGGQFTPFLGDQFESAGGGQFETANGGQFVPALGGQFDRHFHSIPPFVSIISTKLA